MKNGITAIVMMIVCTMPQAAMAARQWTGAYMSGFAGVTVPRDVTVTNSDFFANTTFEDRLTFDPSFYVGGTGGYDFGILRLEGEISYKHAEIDSVTDQDDGFRFRNPTGNVGALAVMFNGFFDFHNPSAVTPYIGGGIGFANLHLSDTFGTDTRGGSSERLILYLEDDDTVFAYQAGAGVEVSLNQNLSLDFGYRYFGTSRGSFDTDFASVTEMRLQSHNAMAGLRVKF